MAILAILIIKIVYDCKDHQRELKNPAVVGIACTFTMAVAILSTSPPSSSSPRRQAWYFYGYLRAYQSPEARMVYLLLAFSVVFYVGSMALLPRILKMKFYPSYSSHTFPLVISGIATDATLPVLHEERH